MRNNLFDLSDQWALVTGANTGLGQAMAIGLAQAGANIILVGRSSAADTAAKIAALGTKVYEIKADLLDKARWAAVMMRLISQNKIGIT